MNGKMTRMTALVLGLLLALVFGLTIAHGQEPEGGAALLAEIGTAFTYQGRLTDAGGPVTGPCDFTFDLYDEAGSGDPPAGGTLLGTDLKPGVEVSEGLFTVHLDFGAGAFHGYARWLQTTVDCGTGADTLSPRQELTPAPYALALPGLWTQQNATSPNLIGGNAANSVTAGVVAATIAGGGRSGYPNRVTDSYGTVGGGYNNRAGNDDPNTDNRDGATVGGGSWNTASGSDATVGGGGLNTASGSYATVGGGSANTASVMNTTVGGGVGNTASASGATVGGGDHNEASGFFATSGGGETNAASGERSTVGGGSHNEASGDYATSGGGRQNIAFESYATVGGGYQNQAAENAIVGGGSWNRAAGSHATVGGGSDNRANVEYATVSGGFHNTANYSYATVGGGLSNHAGGGSYDTVGGGFDNSTSGGSATVSGGYHNIASGWAATVPGGIENTAHGRFSFAAGMMANAEHEGAFVWADNAGEFFFDSTTENEFSARAIGGVRFVLGVDGDGNPTWTCSVEDGTSWSCSSDRDLKENLSIVDGSETLVRLSRLPIFTWNAKDQDPALRHMGPMAQDFYTAFGLGDDDKRIATIDLDGVALAAIQGLYTQNQALQAENNAQQAQIDTLQQQVANLEVSLPALEQRAGASHPSQSRLPSGWLLLGGLVVVGVAVGRRLPGGGQ